MKRAPRCTQPLHRLLLCLGLLLAACAPDGIAPDPALDDEGEGAEGETADDEADADKAGWYLELTVLVPERALHGTVDLGLFTLGHGRDAWEKLRDFFRIIKAGETLVFAVRDARKQTSVSFSLPAEAFLGGGAVELPFVSTSLVPTSFSFLLGDASAEFTLDQSLFAQELRSLSTVTFASFASQLVSDLSVVRNAFRGSSKDGGLQQLGAAYRILARIYYILVVGSFSDAAQASAGNPIKENLGSVAWAFAKEYLGFKAFARRKRLIGASAPLILTAATVASLAASVDLPPEMFQEILGFLCGG